MLVIKKNQKDISNDNYRKSALSQSKSSAYGIKDQ